MLARIGRICRQINWWQELARVARCMIASLVIASLAVGFLRLFSQSAPLLDATFGFIVGMMLTISCVKGR